MTYTGFFIAFLAALSIGGFIADNFFDGIIDIIRKMEGV